MKKLTIFVLALILGLCVSIAPALADTNDTPEPYVATTVDGVPGYFTADGDFVPLDPDNPYIPDAAPCGDTGGTTVGDGDDGGWADPIE